MRFPIRASLSLFSERSYGLPKRQRGGIAIAGEMAQRGKRKCASIREKMTPGESASGGLGQIRETNQIILDV